MRHLYSLLFKLSSCFFVSTNHIFCQTAFHPCTSAGAKFHHKHRAVRHICCCLNGFLGRGGGFGCTPRFGGVDMSGVFAGFNPHLFLEMVGVESTSLHDVDLLEIWHWTTKQSQPNHSSVNVWICKPLWGGINPSLFLMKSYKFHGK